MTTGELGAIGELRYAYVSRAPSGKTLVLTVWTDSTFNLRDMIGEEGKDSAGEDFADMLRRFKQPFGFDHFDRRNASAGGNRVAPKRGGMHAGAQARGDLVFADEGAAGDAAGEALRHRDDVGLNA